MQLPDLSKIQTRLVTCGGIVVAGTLCPLGIGAMAAAVASGIVANDLVAHHLSHISTRLRNADEKLANHDLTHAVGLAIALIIQSFAEADIYPKYKKDLEALAKTAVKAWQNIAEATKGTRDDDFAQIQDEEISALFSQKSEEFFKQPVLTLDAWKSLVKDWLSREANRHLPEDVVKELATQLQTKFTLALREVLKQDFESGGKAFAGLTLSMLGEINATLREQQKLITNYQGNNSQSRDTALPCPYPLSDDVQIAIQQVETLSQDLSGINSSVEEIKINAEQNFQQLGNQINSGFAELLRELGLTEERIKEVLRELKAEMQSWFQQVIDGQKTLIEGQKEIKDAIESGNEKILIILEGMRGEKPVEGGSISFSDPPPTITNWQGRIEEIQQLTDWLNDDNNQFIGIVGLGGVGKSTLAAKLYVETPGFEGKFWADVSQKPSFSVLARRILKEFGKSPGIVEQIEESRLVEVVVNCLREGRFLLVVDNLETLLQAGGGWQDSVYKAFFTRWIECAGKSEVLVTSQEIPDLYQVNPCWVELRGIKPDEGMALLKSLGIQGTDAELREFVEKVAGYPLLLKLVAGFLNDEVGKNAKITDLKDFGLADLSLLMADERIKGIHRQEMVQVVVVLDASFNRLTEKLQQLLLAVSVYRQSFDVTAANGLIDEEVSVQELRDLAKRSLLQEERINGEWRFKFQPLIAAYARQKAGDLTEVHKRAIAYYDSRKKIKQEWQTLEDVREYLEIFYHWCELGDYVKAFDTIRGGSYDECVGYFLDLRGYHQIRVELFDRLVKNWQPQDREDRRFLASLTSLGGAYNCLGEYQQAIQFYQQFLKLARETRDRQCEAISLANLGNAYYSLGEYQQSVHFLQQSLEIAHENLDPQGEAISLNGLGNAYHALAQYQQAIHLLQQSLEISREICDHRGEAISLGNLGNIYYSLGEYQQAIESYQQYLEIARKIGDRQGEANSLNNLGNVYNALAQYQQAIQLLQQSLEIARKIGDRQSEAHSLNNLGIAYNAIAQYQQAIQFLEQSLEISRKIGDRQSEASSLGNLGIAYNSLGEYQQAIESYQKSLQLAREMGDRGGEAISLYNLGNDYYSLGEYPQAIKSYQQSLELAREIRNRKSEALALKNLGNTYNTLAQYQQAIQLLQQSIEISREIRDRSGEGGSLCNLGNAYRFLKEYPKAIDYYQQALRILRDIGHREFTSNTLMGLGNTYQLTGQFEQAIECYQELLQIKRESGDDRKGEANYLQILSRLYFQTGQIKEALAASSQASEILMEIGRFPDDLFLPKCIKSAIKFGQQGKWQIALCFVAGLIAFPFALVWILGCIMWWQIYAKLNRH
ncbi:tetratricopeptide repeat protein [Kamptonema sp. UHCC 0994]|uniref:tetratricopeptide repeat protein n=1 Tax=Kamptonema sp. UHCC 0994 TaxID=3031329 RepID=UPI0023B9503D|nr:tetratricopeptide repeat protein [Kamptonema sp. UHCC 0994]MDF0551488.1 tetratricopeptide repeat protein [Kamptonema sp. UHCC 0994]